MFTDDYFNRFVLPEDLTEALRGCKAIGYVESQEELEEMSFGPAHSSTYDVHYNIVGKGKVQEAEVIRCKNGILVNYMEDYMRRRDPNAMVIGDDLPSDKPRFKELYGYDFKDLRKQTFDWLKDQRLILLPFKAGDSIYGYESLMICPANAAFFALSLANMQGFIPIDEVHENYVPRSIIYVAPPFRHTHFNGKQVVVHNRTDDLHEVFAYNLYPGPSAKKGVFSVLLDIGEHEDWVCCHASAAKVETPYENETVFMHEGASGGGKSEMLEDFQVQTDGRILLGEHTVTGEKYFLNLNESCKIHPIADDMAVAYANIQSPETGKLMIMDAEDGWFLRMDSMKAYGNSPAYEKICIHPSRPLLFFNMEGVPGATCLIWEHVLDSNGQPCTNPRVIIPRDMIENIVPLGPQEVGVRSFGVRMPPSTAEHPDYGVMGLLHVVPPALAWLWRLVSPRGFKNPSIVDGGSKMKSEGVGSYWPFATGKKVTQANMLLRQIMACPDTLNVLIPNQHIGAYKIGFVSEWISREYLARHNGIIKMKHLTPARCPLFGYSLIDMKVDNQYIRQTFLRPETQSKLGEEGYDAGAKILVDFFKEEISQFLTDELDPLGRQIIECCLNDGTLEDYLALTPMNLK